MLIDAHSHLDRYELVGRGALDSALAEIAQRRIFTISNSMDLPSYRRSLEIGERCDLVLPIFGVHPWNAPDYAHRLDDLAEATEHSPMLGEIGLDHHFIKDASAYPDQSKVFEFFLRAASEYDKVVNLHTKGAESEVLRLLECYEVPRVIVHWYSGPLDVLSAMIARRAYFTVGVEVLHSDHIKVIAREIPLEQLLTETDNPGGPKGLIGEPGKPALIQDVVQGVAQARGIAVKDLVLAVHGNLLRLLHGDPRVADAYAGILEEQRAA
jgi:TatD DNase family protein